MSQKYEKGHEMRNEISEIKRAVSVICQNDMRAKRTWSAGKRTSRTDQAMLPALTSASVDAVFEEEAVSFAAATPAIADESKNDEPKNMVASLTAQLVALESQCLNLRRLLDEAGQVIPSDT